MISASFPSSGIWSRGGDYPSDVENEMFGEMRMSLDDPERSDRLIVIELSPDGDAFLGDPVFRRLAWTAEEQVPGHPDEDERDRHDRAVCEDGIGDDYDECEHDPDHEVLRFEKR